MQVGQRLRSAREAKGLSLRELARRLELSASALSQIETGKSRPSIKTLYGIVSELGISMDELFAGNGNGQPSGTGSASGHAAGLQTVVQRGDSRTSLALDSGAVWDRLTADHDPNVDFLFTTYVPGSSSSGSDRLVRHEGREYGLVLSGELDLTVGFERFRLGPGDSCSFAASEPHRLANPGTEPATAVWFVVGRRPNAAPPNGDGG
jgi:transcriptional regulator with XRE-family HTH domain